MSSSKHQKGSANFLAITIFVLLVILLLGRMFLPVPDLSESRTSKQLAEKKADETSPEFWDVPESDYAEFYDEPKPSIVEEALNWKQDYDELVGERSVDVSPKAVQVPVNSLVAELGQKFKSAEDPDSRKIAFQAMMSALTRENARSMREQVSHLHPDSPEFKEFHYRWGKIGGSDAVMYGQQTKKPDMLITLAGWASAEPDAATDWFSNLPKHDKKSFANQGYMMRGLVHGLTDNDPSRALDFVQALHETNHHQKGHMVAVMTGRIVHAKGPEATAAWADSLPEGPVRAVARARVVWDLGKQDHGAAAAWVEGFSHEPDAPLGVEAMAKVWAQNDIAGSVQWLETLEPGYARRKGLSAAYGYWGALEPESAGLYLNQQVNTPDRDFAINGFISGLAHKDPETAVMWAEEITEKGLREAAMVRAGHHFFRRNEEAAKDWMQGTPLSDKAMKQLVDANNHRKAHQHRHHQRK